MNVIQQPHQSQVFQPLQSKYYTVSNEEGKAMQQHQPSLTNNSNMLTSGMINLQDRTKLFHGCPIFYTPTELPRPGFNNYKDQN